MIHTCTFGTCLDAIADRLLEDGDETVEVSTREIETIIVGVLMKDAEFTASLIAGAMHGMDFLEVKEDLFDDTKHRVSAGSRLKEHAKHQHGPSLNGLGILGALLGNPDPEQTPEQAIERLLGEVRRHTENGEN